MQVYLPIAELSANAFELIALGGVTGIMAGLFGIGGGFLLTPILMFMGVAPAVAVATSANQIIASSFSGYLSHLKHKRVDVLMGNHLVAGGILGAALGIMLFKALSRAGQIDLIITLLYVTIMVLIGVLMAREAWLYHQGKKRDAAESQIYFPILEKLPYRRLFPRSEVTHSILLPVGMGALTGLLVAMMGIGGGFIMLPLMLYVLRMPPSVVVGTSLYHMTFTTAFTTLIHAVTTHTVDVVLAALLLVGSAVGAQWGARLAHRLPVHYLRALLAIILFAVALCLAYSLFITPSEIFTLTIIE